nr:AP-3 complex subunit beta [Aegilops tauschii subsp. strangulata]
MCGMRASIVGGGADAHLYDDPDGAATPVLLDSRFDGDKLDALEHLLALISRGVDVAHLSPQRVENVIFRKIQGCSRSDQKH